MREGENQMEVADRKQLRLSLVQPAGFLQRPALGAMTVAARVVAGTLGVATVTLLEMTSQHSGAADFDVVHDLAVEPGQRMNSAVVFSKAAKDIGHFPVGPVGGSGGWRFASG